MHLSEWDPDDGDTKDETIEGMRKAYPDSSDEKPENVHEGTQATWLWLHPLHLCAEWPQGEDAKFHTLQTEGNTNNSNHQN